MTRKYEKGVYHIVGDQAITCHKVGECPHYMKPHVTLPKLREHVALTGQPVSIRRHDHEMVYHVVDSSVVRTKVTLRGDHDGEAHV